MAEGDGRRGFGFRAGRGLRDEHDDFDDELNNQFVGGRRDGGDRGGDNQRGGNRGGGRGRFIRGGRGQGGGRGEGGTRKLVVSIKFLESLQKREPSDIVLTLGNPNTTLREGIKECQNNPDMMRLMINVLAKAFTCNSAPEQLNRVFIIIKETDFFDKAATYFISMPEEIRGYRQTAFKQPISDMITIMEELIAKNPTAVTQFLGFHSVLSTVISELREKTRDIIDDDILHRFQEFTEQKDRLLKKSARRARGLGAVQDRQRQEDAGEPPDDFREIPIFPQTADMQPNDDRYLRCNKVKGRYNDLEHYLDVQFRLLREDFVAPLREGISDYIRAMQERDKKKKNQDVRMYNNVLIISPECGDSGLCHVLQFDVSRLGRVRWNSTKRLMYGSLLCLSSDNFVTHYFATVMNREAKYLEKGLITVRFEHEHDAIGALFGQVFTMAETTAYFESYRHVLTGLQRIRQGDLPFERYIVQCESDIQAPAYLRRRLGTTLDLRPLVDEHIILKDDIRLGENIGEIEEADVHYVYSAHAAPARAVDVLDGSTWPPADLLHLDASQYKAIRTALTKEFVITQGPPGTGKTYIGLKIVKALLHNKDVWSKHPVTGVRDLRPMLIVCYTNHALDQFLEGIEQFYKGDILRVGGRSNSETMKKYSLNNFRQRFRHAQKVPVAVFQGRREARNEMESITADISKVSVKIQVARTNLLHEEFLRRFMDEHYLQLTQQFDIMMQLYPDARQFVGRNYSVIVEWLELGNLAPIVQMEGNEAPDFENQNVPNEADEEELIEVEDEIDAIQAHRRLEGNDADDELDEIIESLIGTELTPKERNEVRRKLAVNEAQQGVALNVGKMGERPKNVQEGEWQTTKKQRKKMKQKVQKNLASGIMMTEEEASAVVDLWKMNIGDKWRLYRFWVQKYCSDLIDQIREKEKEYEEAAGRYREALMQEDKEIMRHSTVIGMTTTGAARYQAILQEIRPRIIVVEEAAEVLEAHIVSSLSGGCEHLILIGDHKQLKPNPTVYKLAKDYSLDVSLFERMVANGISWDCLELQHRMRPEIAELMKPIYPGLRNHEIVHGYENIKGVAKNMFFVSHNYQERHDEDLKSHSNVHEAQYIVALCRYLLQQGYEPKQITVLTLYSGQLFCLRGMMPKEEFEGVRVTVVDNYQGEENDIILLSLVRSNEEGSIGFLKIDNRVCVALSRAKRGLYVIGNFELLREKSKLWNEIVIDMTQKGKLGEALVLYCQNHPDDDGLQAKEPNDFQKAPEGGCNKKCTFRLNCGHVCEMFCHVMDQDHKSYRCRKKCGKIICEREHRCQKTCSQPCGQCQVKVAKKIPRCDHTQQVPCYMDPSEFSCLDDCMIKLTCGHKCQAKCGMAHTQYCNVLVEKTWPCGHRGRVMCHRQHDALCPEPCDGILDCEHRCMGSCGKCFQGRLHRPCKNDCIRILVCGHECTDICNQCPPCKRVCENRCEHSRCNKRCGEPCAPCMEPCTWQCEHYRCGKLCSEPCDRPRCDQPCRKRLTCHHRCIGLCGEPCPTDCKVCDREKVTALFFGNEDESYAKFVLLEDCRNRCIVESDAMDYYMDQKDEKGEIQLKVCPKCKTPIRKNNRYKQIINKTLQDIEGVKRTVLVNKERIKKMEDDIRKEIENEPDLKAITEIRKRLNNMSIPKSEHELAALHNQLTFIKEIEKLEANWKKHISGIAFESDLEKQLKFLSHFAEWVLETRSIMTQQEATDAELEISRSKALLKLLMNQKRARDLGKQLDHPTKVKINDAEKLLKGNGKYKDSLRAKVEACLNDLKKIIPLSDLGVSEEERLMIMKAMQLPAGHWFKCPKGHIYAIGECGGANQVSLCPDCRSEIGGTNHQLRAGNQLAPEMDGARHAAWSEQGNLENYDPFEVRFQ